MKNDNLARLEKYAQHIKNRLDSGIPEKHKNRAKEYKAFLEHELEMTKNKISAIKLGETK